MPKKAETKNLKLMRNRRVPVFFISLEILLLNMANNDMLQEFIMEENRTSAYAQCLY